MLEKLTSLMDDDVFDLVNNLGCRKKDFEDYFYTLDKEKQGDLLHKIAYGLESASHKLADCWSVAKGDDE